MLETLEAYRRYGNYAVVWMILGFVVAIIGLALGTTTVRNLGLFLGAFPGALGVIAVAVIRVLENR
jgi:hypothetical protein